MSIKYNKKSALVIINPCAGKRKARKQLLDIARMLSNSGYKTTVYTTTQKGDATNFVKDLSQDYDLIVCRGGDGTFNEVIQGTMCFERSLRKPLGYVPSGTTNDLAKSLGIPTNSSDAVTMILGERTIGHDIGTFNDKYFAYTASFGIFSKSSYTTPQSKKNLFGHMAYISEGLKELTSIKAIKARVICDDEVLEGEFIFGTVSNSMSIGGILNLGPEMVSLNDGKFEVMMVKRTDGAKEFAHTVKDIVFDKKYSDDVCIFRHCSNIHIEFEQETPWTIDGEFAGNVTYADIHNLRNAVDIFR